MICTQRPYVPGLYDYPSSLTHSSETQVWTQKPLKLFEGPNERGQSGFRRYTEISKLKWSEICASEYERARTRREEFERQASVPGQGVLSSDRVRGTIRHASVPFRQACCDQVHGCSSQTHRTTFTQTNWRWLASINNLGGRRPR